MDLEEGWELSLLAAKVVESSAVPIGLAEARAGLEEIFPNSISVIDGELLLLFLRNPNAALYRDTIYEQVWGGELAYGSKTVDLHVQRLRKKVGWEDCLRAVHKVGYRLEVPQ